MNNHALTIRSARTSELSTVATLCVRDRDLRIERVACRDDDCE